MGEPGGLELVADLLGEALVLTEDHAAQQRRVRGREPGLEAALGALADPVQRARRPAAPRARRVQAVGVDCRTGAAPALERVVAAERHDLPREGDHRPGRRPPARVRGRPHAHHGHVPFRRAVEQPRADDRRPGRPFPHGLEEHRTRLDPLGLQRGEPVAVERRHPGVAENPTRERGARTRQRDRRTPAEHQRDGRRRGDRGRRDGGRQQPRHQREQHRVAGMGADHRRRLPRGGADAHDRRRPLPRQSLGTAVVGSRAAGRRPARVVETARAGPVGRGRAVTRVVVPPLATGGHAVTRSLSVA